MNNTPCRTPPTQRFSVELLGRTWQLERHGDLESLWEAMGQDEELAQGFADDERLPYWTELWPAAMVLGGWLDRQRGRIQGRPCLDLGCGLGLSALVGASLGAQVLAIDYEWPAVSFAICNARRNSDKLVAAPVFSQMDWRQPGLKPAAFACIWGADVMYERRFAAPVAALLEQALAPEGTAWFTDPGRTVFKAFLELMLENNWRCEAVLKEETPQVTAPGPPAGVTVWELTRAV